MKSFSKVFLNGGKERSLKLFHPWVFSGAVAKAEGNPAEGDIVEVVSQKGEFLAYGHFHNGSIKVRLFSFTKTNIDDEFWYRKISDAWVLRNRLGLTNDQSTNAYRLVHGEADGLPGVIVDIYNQTAVIQIHTLGMYRIIGKLAEALRKVYGESLTTVYDKSAETMSRHKDNHIVNSFLLGSETETVILENDLKFLVNWVEGQKTGFFIDQRENRSLVRNYAKGKSVLNTFSYSGGFSMYALQGGAQLVHSVDSSRKASTLLEKNIDLNRYGEQHRMITEDVFDYLKTTNQQYDLIILDPPAFAKHLSAVDNATVGYRNLNIEGFRKIKQGGLLFTFSCSQVIDKQLFRKIVFQAGAQTGRNVRIIHQLSQSADHPISIYHPEGEYLKGLVLLVT